MDALKIAVAEDEALTRHVLSESIRDEGHDVVGEAKDGFELLEVCKNSRVDLIVSDINMPGMNGVEAVRRVFQNHKLPVIFVTGNPCEGVNDIIPHAVCVRKPIEAEDVIQRIPLAFELYYQANDASTR